MLGKSVEFASDQIAAPCELRRQVRQRVRRQVEAQELAQRPVRVEEVHPTRFRLRRCHLRRSSTNTPSAASRSISPSLKPCSVRTSRPCAPNFGGVERTAPGVRENLIGIPVHRYQSSSTAISRCLVCGLFITCATSRTGPAGTPARSSLSHKASPSILTIGRAACRERVWKNV